LLQLTGVEYDTGDPVLSRHRKDIGIGIGAFVANMAAPLFESSSKFLLL
jgi:hypothetical protein